MLTQEELKRVLRYNHETGIFIWIKSVAKRIAVGDVAGNLDPAGYIRIRYKGCLYRAHTLAWLYHYGEFPCMDVDHIDCNKTNNSIANLRLATKHENATNRPLQKNNTSGVKGVRWNNRDKIWTASFVFMGRYIHVGSFKDKNRAASAIKAARELTQSNFINNG
jgi:hypothetical protein